MAATRIGARPPRPASPTHQARAEVRQAEAQPSDDFVAGADAGTVRRPYAALAARGDFQGLVPTSAGEVFVTVRVGKAAANTQPLALLGGLAARREIYAPFEDLVQKSGQTIITTHLPGQPETLARALVTNPKALAHDFKPNDQAKTMVEVLDALGVGAPVSIAGLSYGGGMAALAKANHPDRFDKLLLINPLNRSFGKSNPMYGMMMNNPFNPLGPSMYRNAALAELRRGFPTIPELFASNPDAYHQGLLRLSMGAEDFELPDVIRGLDDVHFLVVPDDSASPEKSNRAAFAAAAGGSFTLAPESETGKHSLILLNPKLVQEWAGNVMANRASPQ